MGILESGASFLRNTLPITVLYTEPGQTGIELTGVWTSNEYDRHGRVGLGAERTTAEAVFHVERAELPTPNQRALIRRNDINYKIHRVEPIHDATFRLHLARTEGSAASPFRQMGRR